MDNNFGSGSDTAAAARSGTAGTNTGDGQNLKDRASEQARSRLSAKQKDAALTLSSLASTLHNSSSQLRDEQQKAVGEYVEKAAEQIDRLANYIQNTDPGEVVDNVERFARRRPAVFIGAAFALGVIGARFLKSSNRRASENERLYSSGLTDREVPTQRAVEGSAGSSAGQSSSDLYGDGGFSAREGMPSSVPVSGDAGDGGARSGTSDQSTGTNPGNTGSGGSGERP